MIRGSNWRHLVSVGTMALGLLLAAMLSSGCMSQINAEPDESTRTIPKPQKHKVCLQSVLGNSSDNPFVKRIAEGIQQMTQEFSLKTKTVFSEVTTEYETDLAKLVKDKCDLIVGVGEQLSEIVYVAAQDNPNVNFVLVGGTVPQISALPNFKTVNFEITKPSFLAGYISAALSRNEIVGTWAESDSVENMSAMYAFTQGVDYYNKIKQQKIAVLGWERQTNTGTVLQDGDSIYQGKQLTFDMLLKNADIIYPVAGTMRAGAGQAVAEYMQQSQENTTVAVVWPEVDGCLASQMYCKYSLTAVWKHADEVIYQILVDWQQTHFSAHSYLGTLENDGVSLAQFHDFHDLVDTHLIQDIQNVKSKLRNGEITVAKYNPGPR